MSFLDKLNRFASNPTNLDISRSRFDRSHRHTTSFKSGDLIPLFIDEVLPGDTFDVNLSAVTRMITPAVPVMDNAFLDVFFFFVPNRLCTLGEKDWQKICGENFQTKYAPISESTLTSTGNTISLGDFVDSGMDGIQPGCVLNYFGIPILNEVGQEMANEEINIMPLIAYMKIWNEFFRDENLQDPILVNRQNVIDCAIGEPYKINKVHDYFTSCLPAPQRGEPVLLPIGDMAPITLKTAANMSNNTKYQVNFTGDGDKESQNVTAQPLNSSGAWNGTAQQAQIYADLSEATGSSINQLRQAFAIQKMLEKDSRGGSRYRSMLYSHFGITIDDKTAQVPEYINGKRIPINMTQVLQTSETNNSPLGSTGAFSNTSFSDSLFIKSFTEFGYLVCVGAVRTAQSYSQGIPRMFSRNRRFDFYYPCFANLGEQPVKTKELYVPTTETDGEYSNRVFGYQEAWAEYRYHPNLITGLLAPNSKDPMFSIWTYTNNFISIPALNDDFIKQPSSQIGDTLAIPDSKIQFIGDFYFNIYATRPMPVYSIPGLIDHH